MEPIIRHFNSILLRRITRESFGRHAMCRIRMNLNYFLLKFSKWRFEFFYEAGISLNTLFN